MDSIDCLGKSTTDFWGRYKTAVAQHYGFDDKQSKQADEILERYAKRMTVYLRENAGEIDEYRLEIKRLEMREKTRFVPLPSSASELPKKRTSCGARYLRG